MALKFETGDRRLDAESGLDSSSLGRSTFIRCGAGRPARYIPEFVHRETCVCDVIVLTAHTLVYRDNKPPTHDARTENFKASGTAISKKKLNGFWKPRNQKPFLEAANAAGSFCGFVASVLWKAWKMFWTTRDIATHYGVGYWQIQRILLCAVNSASRLGYPTFPWRKPWPERKHPRAVWTPARRRAKARAMRRFFRNPANRKMISEATRRGMARAHGA